jgi:hypothetical protein
MTARKGVLPYTTILAYEMSFRASGARPGIPKCLALVSYKEIAGLEEDYCSHRGLVLARDDCGEFIAPSPNLNNRLNVGVVGYICTELVSVGAHYLLHGFHVLEVEMPYG